MTAFTCLCVCSGGTGGGPCPSEDAWLFDEKTQLWTSLATCPSPRGSAAMAPLTSSADRAILIGGSESYSQVISVSWHMQFICTYVQYVCRAGVL